VIFLSTSAGGSVLRHIGLTFQVFFDAVKTPWELPVNTQNAMLRMHVKLLRTARPLKVWRRSIFSKWRLKSALVDIILLELEKAQERRNLTAEELEFKK